MADFACSENVRRHSKRDRHIGKHNHHSRVSLPATLSRPLSESGMRDRMAINALRSYAKTPFYAAPKSTYHPLSNCQSTPMLWPKSSSFLKAAPLKTPLACPPSKLNSVSSSRRHSQSDPSIGIDPVTQDPSAVVARSHVAANIPGQGLAPLNFETKRTCNELAKSVCSPDDWSVFPNARICRGGKWQRKKSLPSTLALVADSVPLTLKENEWLDSVGALDPNKTEIETETVALRLRAYLQSHKFDVEYTDEDDVCPSLKSRTVTGKNSRIASKSTVASDRADNSEVQFCVPFNVAQPRSNAECIDSRRMSLLLSQLESKPMTAPPMVKRENNLIADSDLEEPWDSATSLAKMAGSLHMSLAWIYQAYQEFKRWLPPENAKMGTMNVDEFKHSCAKEMNCEPENDDFIEGAIRTAFSEGKNMIGFQEWVFWYTAYAFSDRFNSTSRTEASNRKLSKQLGIVLADVQKLHRDFLQFDQDGSDYIEEKEFRGVLASILKGTEGDIPRDRVHRAWLQAGNTPSGLDFENFLMWYKKYMYDPDNTASALEVIHGISLPKCSRQKSLKFSH